MYADYRHHDKIENIMYHNHTRLKADLILIFVAVIWGSAFSAQRVAAEQMGVYIYNGSRFLLGAITVFIIAKIKGQEIYRSLTRYEVIGGIIGALFIFAGASFQQAGLIYTTAGKSGFITGLYVVLVPILIVISNAWKRKHSSDMEQKSTLHWTVWVSSIAAVIGLYLLSAAETVTANIGDFICLAGTLFWALHILLIGHLANKVDTLRIALIQYIGCSILNFIFLPFFEEFTLDGIIPLWWTIAFVGIFSVGIAYTLQVEGQKIAPETDASIILSLEAVFAAIFGWIFLNESLTIVQIIGCVLIFAGMLLVQFPHSSFFSDTEAHQIEVDSNRV